MTNRVSTSQRDSFISGLSTTFQQLSFQTAEIAEGVLIDGISGDFFSLSRMNRFLKSGLQWGAALGFSFELYENILAVHNGSRTPLEGVIDTIVDTTIAAMATGGGTMIGAEIGLICGSVVPVLGNMIGIIVGAYVGYLESNMLHHIKESMRIP